MKFEFESLQEVKEFAAIIMTSEGIGIKKEEVKKEEVKKAEAKKEDPKPVVVKEEEIKQEVSEEAVSYTLEQVRAKLTELSRAGKAKEVKKLLTDAGATNVSTLGPDKYAEVMQKAGEL